MQQKRIINWFMLNNISGVSRWPMCFAVSPRSIFLSLEHPMPCCLWTKITCCATCIIFRTFLPHISLTKSDGCICKSHWRFTLLLILISNSIILIAPCSKSSSVRRDTVNCPITIGLSLTMGQYTGVLWKREDHGPPWVRPGINNHIT